MSMAELVLALDAPDRERALNLLAELEGSVSWIKIGLELFVAGGPLFVEEVKKRGFRIFLDLKFYDIPNTVAGAVRAACVLKVDMLSIHLQGGQRMCEAACAAAASRNAPLLMGVTVLTSFAQGELPGVSEEIPVYAAYLAKCARDWGLNGVVCSGFEAARIKRDIPGLLCLCPGIRLENLAGDDQRRSMTPEQAVAAGADFLVAGRPILQASNPASAARLILERMA